MLNNLIIPITVCIFTLTACTSKPREVSASIPLVSSSQEKPNKQEVPAQYWSFLSDPNQTNVDHDIYQITLNKPYTSALGQTCRELTILDKKHMANQDKERRTACEIIYVNKDNQPQKAWFLEKQIIESRVYVEL